MNSDIADILKSQIAGLNFVERIAGLVRPVTKTDIIQDDQNNETTVRKIFPVACDVTAAECEEDGKLLNLVPNSERRTIIYFEDGGVQFKDRQAKVFTFTSRLKLICWINLKMFDTTSCSISALLIAAIIKQFPQQFQNFNNTYQKLIVRTISELPKTPAIFSDYTYSEETNQYLMYPFDYFALEIETDFGIHESCINEVQLATAAC